METLALHAVVHPALAGTEGEAGDVLVGTAGRELALRAAGRVCVRVTALTLQLGALQPAGQTAALVTAVLPLRPVTPPLPRQSAVQGAVPPRLTVAPVTAGRVDTGGRVVTGRRHRLALVHIPAGGGVLQRVVVGGVARLAGTVVPAHSVYTDALLSTAVHSRAQRTLVQVQLAVVAGVAGGAGATVRGHAEAAVMTGGLTQSCKTTPRYQTDRETDCDLTVTLVTGSCVAGPAPAGMSPRPRGETVSVRVAPALSGLANVHRETGGVGAVQPVASRAAAGVAALQVDTEAVLQGAVVTLGSSSNLTLVHILTVSPIALHTAPVSQTTLWQSPASP